MRAKKQLYGWLIKRTILLFTIDNHWLKMSSLFAAIRVIELESKSFINTTKNVLVFHFFRFNSICLTIA